jgi:hypothetical protein
LEGVENRVNALRSGAELTGAGFLAAVPILVAPLTDILRDGPSAPIWRPVTTPAEQVSWTHRRTPLTAPFGWVPVPYPFRIERLTVLAGRHMNSVTVRFGHPTYKTAWRMICRSRC